MSENRLEAELFALKNQRNKIINIQKQYSEKEDNYAKLQELIEKHDIEINNKLKQLKIF